MENLKTATAKRNQNGLHSIFDELFGTETNNGFKPKTNNNTPAVNIKEDDNAFFLEFALPGFSKEQISIALENDLLSVSAEKNTEPQLNANYTRREFQYSNFKRSFKLPNSIDNSKIKATQTNGILNIEIPKKEEAKPKPARQIEIEK